MPLKKPAMGDAQLPNALSGIITKCIHQFYEDKAKELGVKEPKAASITFTQRWGSSVNLNPHLHILALDGVYSFVKAGEGEVAKLRTVDTISNQETAALLDQITKKTIKKLIRKGYLDQDGELVQHPELDSLFADHDSLAQATASSIGSTIAFGPNAGSKVSRIGPGFGYTEEIPLAKGKHCYQQNGFSIHAGRSVNTHSRNKLEELIQYMARGPISNERIKLQDDGKVQVKLKTQWSDGTTHLLFTPHELLEKLTALIPPPRAHLVRWSGAFAPASPLRKMITLNPDKKKAFQFSEDDHPCQKSKSSDSWVKLLERGFKIDVTTCDKCQGKLHPVCAVKDPKEIRRYLEHVGLPGEPPEKPPPISQGSFAYEF